MRRPGWMPRTADEGDSATPKPRRGGMLLDGTVTDSTGWGILATGHIASVFARDLLCCRTKPGWSPSAHERSRGRWRSQPITAFHGHTTHAELAGDPDVDGVRRLQPP